MSWIENRFEEGLIVTSLDSALAWARRSSLWPLTVGLACCAVELNAAAGPRYDVERLGLGPLGTSPRQADLMIVAGTVTYKMAARLRRLYDEMASPKYVIAMGACAVAGGPYAKCGYSVVKGVDLIVPVDVYISGCPPRPEAFIDGLLRLQEKIAQGKPRVMAAASNVSATATASKAGA